MSSYLQCRQQALLESHAVKQNSNTTHFPVCDRFLLVHYHSGILDKLLFFHPLIGTIHPDSFVRDLISGQSIDRHSTFAQSSIDLPHRVLSIRSPRPLRSLFTFGYTRTSSTRTRTRPLPEFSASLPLRLLIWLCPAVSLPAHPVGHPSGDTRILHLRVLKVDYEMCLQVMKFNPLSSRHRRYRPA